MSWLSETPTGVRLLLHVQPRASQTAIAGLHGGALKVRLAAPPVDGEANSALVRWIAKQLGVPAGRVTLRSGAASRRKTVEVAGVTVPEASRLLQRAAEG